MKDFIYNYRHKFYYVFFLFVILTTAFVMAKKTGIDSLIITVLEVLGVSVNFPMFFGVATFIAAFLGGVTAYLNKDVNKIKSSSREALEVEVFRIKQELKRLKVSHADPISKVGLSEAERNEIIDFAKKRIVGGVINSASESLRNEFFRAKNKINISAYCADMTLRLENEISRLNRRGGVNLAFGITMALTGMIALSYIIAKSPESSDKLSFFMHLAPKLSFVLLVELFAYFFLRLYKNSFEEVKYFQNEITNLESKVLAVKLASNVNSQELMKEVVINLMNTERNFILDKGQTTVALEKEKLRGSEDEKMISALTDLLKNK